MIDPVTLSYTVAQIAGIFVGFGALIALTTPSGVSKAQKDLLTLCVMIGLFIIVAAILPILLMAFGLADDLVWFVSAGIILVFDWLTIWPQRGLIQDAIRRGRTGELSFAFGVEACVQIPLILILLPVLPGQSAALYAATLFISLFQAAMTLMSLVLDLTAKEDAPPE